MNIGHFQGKNESEAMDKARQTMGPDVTYMSTKVLKKSFFTRKPVWVEVTVGKDDEPDLKKSREAKDFAEAVASIDKLRKEAEQKGTVSSIIDTPEEKKVQTASDEVPEKLDKLFQLLQENVASSEKTGKKVPEGNANNQGSLEADESEEINAFLKLLYKTMIDNEVAENYANQMIEEITANYDPKMDMEYILSNIYQKMIVKFDKPQCITMAEKGPKIVFFIGPTGVGKTTTLAKIASHIRLEDKKKVALITADTYRIAASDQLGTYAEILKVPCNVAYSVEEMKEIYSMYKQFDFILVDTAGHSHHNENQQKEMSEFVHAFDGICETEVYLVLSMTTKYKDLISIADAYKEVVDYKLIFTKLDETSCYGNMLNLKLHTGAPMSYVTNGQEVPRDFSRFNPQDAVKKLLQTH